MLNVVELPAVHRMSSAGGLVHRVQVEGQRLRLSLLTFGAAIESLSMRDAADGWADVHLSLPDHSDYGDRERNPYLGASVGRWANRIAGARFVLDGREVRLSPNEGPNQLHGGPEGFDWRIWDVADVDERDDGGAVKLQFTSLAGDQGFPGTLAAAVTYDLDGERLRITYEATTDAPTVVNLTNHAYWNLDGAATVHDHALTLCADEVLLVSVDGIPTGPLTPVDSTPFDVRTRTRLGDVVTALAPGLDHCFAVRGDPGTLRPAALLEAPSTGRWLLLRTDQPGLQVYTGNHLRSPFVPHAAVALETQRFPDAPNRPELGVAVLRPGERYTSMTELRFGTGEPPPLA